jgi:hypothetical protein
VNINDYHTQRWSKPPNDRLYISTHAGDKQGWVCLLTGTVTPAVLTVNPKTLWAVTKQWAAVNNVQLPNNPKLLPADLSKQKAGSNTANTAKNITLWQRLRSKEAKKEHAAWTAGKKGEQLTGDVLRKLPKTWKTLHSIPINQHGADIDHLTIGPSGVFTVNTKNHPTSKVTTRGNGMWVNGTVVPYHKKALMEADLASNRLTAACGRPVVVIPVLVIHAETLNLNGYPGGVTVVNAETLIGNLTTRGEGLTPDTVERVYKAAVLSATWNR